MRALRIFGLVLVLSSCGQLGFDPIDAAVDSRVDATVDAALDGDVRIDGGLDGGLDATNDARNDAPADASDGGDAGDDAGPPLGALYISPTGSDANPGTVAAPFRTFAFAVAQLSAGDTLLLLPGIYAESTGTGHLNVDCRPTSTACDGRPCANGTALEPIVIRSLRERQAVFRAEPGDSAGMVDMYACKFYVLEGFTLVGADVAGNPSHSMGTSGTQNVTLRRHLLSGNNRFHNSHLLLVYDSLDMLIEENEFYNFHRVGLSIYLSQRVTARRNYVNARNYADIAGGYVSGYPSSADTGYTCSHSASCLFENNVSDGALDDAFDLSTGIPLLDGDPGAGDNARYFGNIVVGAQYGIFGASGCDSMPDCASIDERSIMNATLRDNVILRTIEHGIFFRGAQGVTIEQNSLHETTMRVDVNAQNRGLPSNASILDNLVGGTGSIITVADLESFVIDNNNTFPGGISTTGLGILGANSQVDPQLAGCLHRTPSSSPLSGPKRAGGEVGASLVHRYVDGVRTDVLLWNPDGSFPCGAVVPGINVGAESCRSFDALNVLDPCPIE